MSGKNITNITAFYFAVPKGKRKPVRLSHSLATLDDHQRISPDDMNDYERKFWQYVDETPWKVPPTKGTINVNFGSEDGEIVMVQLLPKQTLLILRS